MERRLVLSQMRPLPRNSALIAILGMPGYTAAVRPNTPVVPFNQLKDVSFIDPSVEIRNGIHVVLAGASLVAPYVRLDATAGYIKIGAIATIADNARLIANPARGGGGPVGIRIGDKTLIGDNALVVGPSVVGSYGTAARPTFVGPGAFIDGATIQPGAYVSTLARVGPGITIPTGIKVLPGKNVTTQAEAANPALGKVTTVTQAELDRVAEQLAQGVLLAAGYAALYHGDPATGLAPLATTAGIYNGNLAAVSGSSYEPGPANGVTFEPGKFAPTFVSTHSGRPVVLANSFFRARAIGQVAFGTRPALVAHRLGRSNSIRADEGQPISIGSINQTGDFLTIRSPLAGSVTIGREFRAGNQVVILGGPAASTRLGDRITVNDGAIIEQSTIGDGSTLGARSVVIQSNLAPGTVVPAGTILVRNVVVGTVEW